MKTIFAAVAVSLMMSPAVAATAAEDTCTAVGKIAIASMTARQDGIPLLQMLEITSGSPLARTIVLEAYGKPKFNTKKAKLDYTIEFGNVFMLTCLKELTQ